LYVYYTLSEELLKGDLALGDTRNNSLNRAMEVTIYFIVT